MVYFISVLYAKVILIYENSVSISLDYMQVSHEIKDRKSPQIHSCLQLNMRFDNTIIQRMM